MELFAALVAAPSVSSPDARCDQGNRAAAELLANRLEDLGFSVELLPVVQEAEKYNLLARCGTGADGEGLVLSGHLDTVPCEAAAWRHDPFTLTEEDGRLYGLGSCDMKGFFPIVVESLADVDLQRLRRPLYVLGTANEESDMAGVSALADGGRRLGRYALIGEPTGLRPIHAHKGALMERLRLLGRSAHGSNPAAGLSALVGLPPVLRALLARRRELAEHWRDDAFEVPVPTLNLGSIHGGDSFNRVCGCCELGVDVRLLPGMDPAALRRELYARVAAAVQGSGLRLETETLVTDMPAMYTPPEARVVRLAEELSGRDRGMVAFATEGPWLNAMQMETVILGAGDIAQAHGPDEYLPLAHIDPMIHVVRGMVQRLCLEPAADG